MRFSPRSKQRVQWFLAHAKELRLGRSAVQRLHWFAFALEHNGNASLTCRHFGIARSTYLRWVGRFDPNDERSLEDCSKRPQHLRRSQLSGNAIAAIKGLRRTNPTMNRAEIAQSLIQHGFAVSPSTVGRIITKHRLFFGDIPSHRSKRQVALDIDFSTCEQPRSIEPNPLTDSPSFSPSFA